MAKSSIDYARKSIYRIGSRGIPTKIFRLEPDDPWGHQDHLRDASADRDLLNQSFRWD